MKKLTISNMFLFKGVYRLFFLAFLCMIGTSYLGNKTPEIIYQLSANFNDKLKFQENLFFFDLFTIGSIFYQAYLSTTH